jgi:hypothetical protein
MAVSHVVDGDTFDTEFSHGDNRSLQAIPSVYRQSRRISEEMASQTR